MADIKVQRILIQSNTKFKYRLNTFKYIYIIYARLPKIYFPIYFLYLSSRRHFSSMYQGATIRYAK